MSHLALHLRIHLSDNRVIASTLEHRREVSRVIFAQGRSAGLLAFNLPDSHLHLIVLCALAIANRLVQRITSSLRQRLKLPVPFIHYPPVPITTAAHLDRAVRYVLRQDEHHQTFADPGREASNLPDLLGMRLLGRYTAENLQRWLPRLNRRDLLGLLGLDRLEPADGPLELLGDAARAASGLTHLDVRNPEGTAVRCALIHLTQGRVPVADLARALRIGERTAYRLRTLPPDPDLVRAIRLQLAFRSARDCQHPDNAPLVLPRTGSHRALPGAPVARTNPHR